MCTNYRGVPAASDRWRVFNTFIKGIVMNVNPNAFQLICAIQGLSLNKTGMMLTRGATNKNLMAIISGYTGKDYKRNQVDDAIKDARELLDKFKQEQGQN